MTSSTTDSSVRAPALAAERGAVRAPFHIPSLDGLRAASFFIVFAAHAGLDKIVPGGFGVTVFFFLSGYLITTLLRVEADRTGHISLRNFYIRRSLRILPPFYIVLLAATALGLSGFLRGAVPPQPLPVASQLLHFSNYWIAAHGWGGVAIGTGVYWSLAVEEHFYLLFPALFLALKRLNATRQRMALWFWGSCVVVLAWRCLLVFVFHANVDRTYLCSDTRVDSIAFGCALAVWNNPALDVNGDEAGESALWARILCPAGVALLLVTFLVRGTAFRETFRYTLQGIGLTPVFVAAVRWPHWPVWRPLHWRPMRFVGTLSYSLYLVHQGALAAVEQHTRLGGVARALAALLVSLAIAWAMYRLVERPCATLRKRLSAAE
jgi:peptidoglycan/LPS O-acetylase OafA/YrhL